MKTKKVMNLEGRALLDFRAEARAQLRQIIDPNHTHYFDTIEVSWYLLGKDAFPKRGTKSRVASLLLCYEVAGKTLDERVVQASDAGMELWRREPDHQSHYYVSHWTRWNYLTRSLRGTIEQELAAA
jgi:hypothetical protein